MNKEEEAEIWDLIRMINAQISAVEEQAKLMGVDPSLMRKTDGSWLMIELVSAKAKCFHALALMRR